MIIQRQKATAAECFTAHDLVDNSEASKYVKLCCTKFAFPRNDANRCISLKLFENILSTMDNHWWRCRADQQPLNVLQGRKLLANPGDAIESPDVPLRATRTLVTGASGGG